MPVQQSPNSLLPRFWKPFNHHAFLLYERCLSNLPSGVCKTQRHLCPSSKTEQAGLGQVSKDLRWYHQWKKDVCVCVCFYCSWQNLCAGLPFGAPCPGTASHLPALGGPGVGLLQSTRDSYVCKRLCHWHGERTSFALDRSKT